MGTEIVIRSKSPPLPHDERGLGVRVDLFKQLLNCGYAGREIVLY
jgi:hypothetical protein